MPALTPKPKMQFFNETGKPLVGGKVYTYYSGTTTPLATYKNYEGTALNTNPIILDSRGEASIWIGANSYTFTVYDADGVLQSEGGDNIGRGNVTGGIDSMEVALNTEHRSRIDNPHGTTKEQVGLGNVTNDQQVKASTLETTLSNNAQKVPTSSAVWTVKTDLEALIGDGGTGTGGTSTIAALTIAIIGDSITAPHAFADSWPQQLQESCNQMGLDIDIKDWAINGATFYKALNDTTAHAGGTKTQVEQCIAQGADIIFVCLGINDSLYAATRTQAQIIQDGTDVYNALHAGLPDAIIAIVHEAPHNLETVGVVPSSLTNDNAVPFSHQKITYRGRGNCRVNNATYKNTAITGAALTRHQQWGNVANALNAIYGAYITVNFWKLARIGCYVDLLHPDGFGHMWISMEVLKWLAGNNGIDNEVLNSIELRTSTLFMDLDTFYAEMITGTMSGYSISVANYAGYDLPNARNNWMFAQRRLFGGIGPLTTNSAADTLHQYFRGTHPGVTVYFSWGGADFVSSGKTTSAEGVFMDSYSPVTLATSLSWNVTAGTHAIAYAFALADGSHDVFEGTVTYAVTVAPGDESGAALVVDGVAKLTATTSALSQPNGISTFFGESGTSNPVQIFGTLETGATITTAGNIGQQATTSQNSFFAPTYIYNSLVANSISVGTTGTSSPLQVFGTIESAGNITTAKNIYQQVSTGQNSFYAATYVYNTLIANNITSAGTLTIGTINGSGTATVNTLNVGTSGSTHHATVWGNYTGYGSIHCGGTLTADSGITTPGAIGSTGASAVSIFSGIIKAYKGYGGNTGGVGAQIACRGGNMLSFNWTGSHLQFYIDGSLVYTTP